MENRENIQKSSFFFPNEGRAEVLLRLTERVATMDSISVVVGPPGSGKTRLCRTFAEKVDGDVEVFYFAYPPQSFEDFITLLADKLKCNVEESGGEKNEQSRRLLCIEKITSTSKKNLFICDNAQGIYLATLERIIKFISECKAQETDVHLVLVGDSLVADACQSLSINEFSGSDVSVFTLNPLDKKETGLFYQCVLGHCAETGDSVELSTEVLERLYSKTDGNMKKINLIADRATKTDESDASFFSLLNDMEGEERGVNKRLKRQIANKKKEHDKKRARFLLFGGLVTVLCVVAGVFYFWPADEVVTVSNSDVPKNITTVALVETEQVENKVLSVASSAKEEIVSVVIRESGLVSAVKANTKAPVIIPEIAVVDEPKAVEVKMQQPVIEKKQILAVVDIPVTKEIIVVQENNKTAVAKITPEDKAPLIKSQPRKILTTTFQATSSTEIQPTSKHLYEKTVLAGNEWEKKGEDAGYTMQLMALTSENAEAHLQGFLDQANYRTVADSLRVVHGGKKASPTLFVFYGEYSSADKAKEARELLPHFLLEHKPYILPIAAAIEKADS